MPLWRGAEHPQVDAVIDQLDGRALVPYDSLDVFDVGLATCDHSRGFSSPAAEGRIGNLVQIPRMGGEAEGKAGQPVGQQPEERRVVREMRVNVADRAPPPSRPHLIGDEHGAVECPQSTTACVAPPQMAPAESEHQSGKVAGGRSGGQPEVRTGALTDGSI